MCNAWNHSSGCTCGWGGEGHAGQSHFSSFSTSYSSDTNDWWIPSLTTAYSSYLNPNARCPVCGAPVFFYKSPSGGSVFFDELGPPWPKHPCTDNSSRPVRLYLMDAGQLNASPTQQPYTWQREGWQPFVILSILGIDKDFLKVSGRTGETNMSFYIERLMEHHMHDNSLSQRTLAQFRALSDSRYQLSILMPNGTPITIYGFVLLSDARAEREQELAIRKAQLSKRQASSQYSNFKQPQARPERASAESNHSPVETALAMAFRKAQENQRKP